MAQFTVERALASIFWMDENGRIHFANDTAINQYGYSLKEFQRLSILDINPNFDEKRYAETWAKSKEVQNLSFESSHVKRMVRSFR